VAERLHVAVVDAQRHFLHPRHETGAGLCQMGQETRHHSATWASVQAQQQLRCVRKSGTQVGRYIKGGFLIRVRLSSQTQPHSLDGSVQCLAQLAIRAADGIGWGAAVAQNGPGNRRSPFAQIIESCQQQVVACNGLGGLRLHHSRVDDVAQLAWQPTSNEVAIDISRQMPQRSASALTGSLYSYTACYTVSGCIASPAVQ
jgi:hypothetical protein